MKIDNEKILAITEVGQAQPRLREALFMKNIKHLDNVNFICVDEDLGHDVVSEMLSMFTIECGEICSALSSKKLRIINKEFLTTGKYTFKYTYDIGLDTQIVSYIQRYMSGGLEENNFKYIKPLRVRREIESTVHIEPYIFENYIKNKKFTEIEKESVYNTFLFLDLPLIPMISYEQAVENSQRRVEALQLFESSEGIKELEWLYLYNYCLLLETVWLKFCKNNLKEKMIEMLKFQNEKTCTTDPMFINIAYEYWKKGANVPFFNKIQKGQKNILEKLKNMAWDLFHWRRLFNSFTLLMTPEADISIPLIYSGDRRFLDLVHLIKLNCMAVDKNEKQVFPFYEKDALDDVLNKEEQFRFLNEDTMKYRNENKKNVNIIKIIEKLEKEILKLGVFEN